MSKPAFTPGPDYEAIASDFWFSGKTDMAARGVQFRKARTSADIKSAQMKACKHGHQKIERELSMFALYLKDVFKPAKATK